MDSLPWILVYGERVWQLSLVALPACGALWAFVTPRVAAAVCASKVRGSLRAPVTSPNALREDEPAVLRGVLVAGPSRCRDFDGREGVACATADVHPEPPSEGPHGWTPTTRRAASLSLSLGGGVEVTLEGPVRVRTGSRELWAGRALPLHLALSHRAGERAGALSLDAVYRSLEQGDRVLASGVLALRTHASAPELYRGASSRWALVPGPKGAVELASEGPPRVDGGPLWRLWKGALVGAAAWLAVFGLGGALAEGLSRRLDRAPMERASGQDVDQGVPLTAASFAATTPFYREAALGHLARALSARRRCDASTASARVGLSLLQRDPEGAVRARLEHGDLRGAAALARAHGLARLGATAHYALGEFSAASALLEGASAGPRPSDPWAGLFDARVHLLAGRPERAASAFGRVSAHARRVALGTTVAGASESAWRSAQVFGCAADALRARGGARSPRPEVSRPGGTAGVACALLVADTLDGRARLELLATLGGPGSTVTLEDERLAWLLSVEAGGPWETARDDWFALPSDPESLVLAPASLLRDHVGSLERALAERLEREAPVTPEGRSLRARLAARVAVFESVAGAHDQAALWVARAEAALGPRGASVEVGRLRSLRAAVALRAGRLAEARAVVEDPTLAFGGVSEAVRDLVRFGVEGTSAPLAPLEFAPARWGWEAAGRGDGAALAAVLYEQELSDEGAPYVWLGARRLTRGRDALRSWARWGLVPRTWDSAPRERLAHTVDRALAAEALGDPASTRDLTAVAQRFRAAMLRRDLAVALDVLERGR